MPFIFVISASGESAEKSCLIRAISQMDQHWELDYLEIVIRAMSGVAVS